MSLLAEYVRTHDPGLFQALTDQHQPMVYRICRRQLGNDADAQEATQDVFHALFVHAADIRSNLDGWLYKTSLNTARATLRSRLARSKREHAKAVPLCQTDHATHKSELAEAVLACLKSLAPRTRAMIVDHFVLKKSQATIANELGVSQSTVCRRIDSARREMRLKLEQNGVDIAVPALAVILGQQQAQATATQGAIATADASATSAKGHVLSTSGTATAALAGILSKPGLLGVAAASLLVVTLAGGYLITGDSRFEPGRYELTTVEQVNRNLSIYPSRNGGIVRVQTVTTFGQKRPRHESDRVEGNVLVLGGDHTVKFHSTEPNNEDQLDTSPLPDGWAVSKVFVNRQDQSQAMVIGKSDQDQYGLFLASDGDLISIAGPEEGFLYFYGAAVYDSGLVAFSALHEDDPPGMNVSGVYVWDGQSIRAVIEPGNDSSSRNVVRAFLCRGPLDADRAIRLALDFGPDVDNSVIVSAQPGDEF